jgi:predicted amidohydrolase YtcJ
MDDPRNPGLRQRLLLAGGPILTMGDPLRVEAVAVIGERIAHAGALDDCRAALGSGRRELDLGGRALLPGFVDAHCHPFLHAHAASWLPVGPDVAPTIDALVEVLRAEAEQLPSGLPLRAFGYDYRRYPELRHPHSTELDRAATDREIYVMNVSGHGGVLNSAGLAAHGITPHTPDVDGGVLGRFPDGTLNGLVWDAACDLLTGPDGVKIGRHGPNFHLPEPPERMAGLLDDAQAEFLGHGVTTAVDAQVSRREMEAYLEARSADRLRFRVEMLVLSALLDEVLALGMTRRLGDDRLAFAGIKLYADGSLGAGTAWFPDGYAADRDQRGHLFHEPERFRSALARAHAAGLQTATHAQSPHAISLVLDAIEAAQRSVPRLDARHRIEHCGLPTDALIERMAALGVVPVPQPGHQHAFGEGVVRTVGRELGERYEPIGLFARAGIPVVLSSDAPVAPPHPLPAIRAAVDRHTAEGGTLGGPELRVDVLTALKGHTIGAAWSIHREASVGSLEAGKLADLAVLSADPLAVEVEALGEIRVEETWVGGERVH